MLFDAISLILLNFSLNDSEVTLNIQKDSYYPTHSSISEIFIFLIFFGNYLCIET